MDINALKAKLEKLNPARDPNRAMWFKASEDEQAIRMLPYPHANDPFIEVFFHYNIGEERSLICPKEMAGKPCPICEAADKLKNMGGDDNWQLAKSLFPKLRTYSPIILRTQTVWKIVLFLPVFCPTIGAHLIISRNKIKRN
jgi:hypothetical protein